MSTPESESDAPKSKQSKSSKPRSTPPKPAASETTSAPVASEPAASDRSPGSGEQGWSEKDYVEPEPWTFAGWGHAEHITDLEAKPLKDKDASSHLLSEWRATAICGNDITSSVLYVAAICTLYAGIYAPIALALVGLVLYTFRKIYAEVGSALPLNGGAYNVLLNTTSKYKASMAACLTLLSYIATAVISSTEALHYAHSVWPAVPVFAGTIVLLGIFAALNIVGITESSSVALVIFCLHIATLLILVGFGIKHVSGDLTVMTKNFASPPPQGFAKAVFFGFAAGLLGISGFESSANFIEEQKPGVFPKTLRNMWIAVFFFNTAISLLALGILPMDQFEHHGETLLSEMASRSAGATLGPLFRSWIGINAFLVLSGAVLTSYVGVTGLVKRMSLDRCLPQFLLKENSWRHTPHLITLSFFGLCVSILLITQGNVGTLAGVYTISFLFVMGLFAVGNRLLALKRARLPRDVRASWFGIVIALIAVSAGLVGNVLKKDPITGADVGLQQSLIFLIYFLVTAFAVTLMFGRVRILQAALYIGQAVHQSVRALNSKLSDWTLDKVEEINGQAIVFFTRGDGLANLRRAIEYVLDNEHTKNLKVVHVYSEEKKIPTTLADQLRTLDRVYPEIRIDFIAVQGKFGPGLIDQLSERLGVPKNYMFIGCPGDRFPHNIGDLGGVRLIV